METEHKEKELKHLGFVRIAAIQALVCVCNLYNYAKSNSGPLRSAVGTVESAVTTVVGPVYERFKGVPDDILVYVDTKASFIVFVWICWLYNFFYYYIYKCCCEPCLFR